MVTGGETGRGFAMATLGRRRFVQLAMAAAAARAQQAPKPLRLGVVADCTDADAGIRRVKELGFATCQVTVAAYDGGTAKKLRAALDQYGIEATALIVTGPGSEIDTFQDGPRTVGLVPPKTRDDRITLLRKASDFAKTAGIPAVLRQIGFLPEDAEGPLFKQYMNALWHVADYCKHNGQSVLCTTGHETPLALLRLIRAAAFPNIGVNLDPASLIRFGKGNPVDALDTFGPLVMSVDAKDGMCPTEPDALGEARPTGKGRVDFPRLVARLKEIGYDGPITIDAGGSGQQQNADIMAAKRYLEGLIG
ncbi:MAG: sugar phosphate isomerase/epimerase family protein [Bryobacteraceae bacterium]